MMTVQYKNWLASLVPLADFARQYVGDSPNLEGFERFVRSYEGLVVVGVKNERYVDTLLFEHYYYAAQTDKATRRPIRQLGLIRGEDVATKLQEAVRDNTAEMYGVLSRIRDLQRQELLESDTEQRKLLGNEIAELKVKHGLTAKAMHEAERKLSDFMTEYGSKPENVRPKREVVEKKVVQSDAESGKAKKPRRKRLTGAERVAKLDEAIKKAARKKRGL